ncbi:MAG: hypothetical protein H6719_16335 [Sandaracinaceae bacterium]|nr:hypothetical protein [Sandaracinaceae bacterium]
MVLSALLVPSIAIERSSAWWSWLASFRPGTVEHAEGVLRASPPVDDEIVLIGSSVSVVDVIDEPLGRALGRPVTVAGMMAAPVCATAMLAPELVARRPRTLVYVVAPRDLERCQPRTRNPFDLDIALHAIGPWEIVRDEDWLAAAVSDTSALVRHRGVFQMLGHSGAPGWRFHPRHGGRVSDAALAVGIARRAPRLRAATYDGTGPSARALARLATRLREVGTEVVLVPAPVVPALVEASTGEVGTAWHRDAVADVARVAAALELRHVTPEALGEYSSEDFRDPMHLGPSGQIRYTRALAEALR